MNAEPNPQPLLIWLRRKWRRRNPFAAPWPPGWLGRIADHPQLGRVFQLRDGCETPREMYFELHPQAWRGN